MRKQTEPFENGVGLRRIGNAAEKLLVIGVVRMKQLHEDRNMGSEHRLAAGPVGHG